MPLVTRGAALDDSMLPTAKECQDLTVLRPLRPLPDMLYSASIHVHFASFGDARKTNENRDLPAPGRPIREQR